MLFKNAEGVYIEILRSQYTNDTAYYTSIMKNAKANKMANEMGANEMANAIGANAIGANAIGANAIGANAIGANAIGANAIGANAIVANAIGANEIVANANEIVEMTRIKSLVYKTLKHI